MSMISFILKKSANSGRHIAEQAGKIKALPSRVIHVHGSATLSPVTPPPPPPFVCVVCVYRGRPYKDHGSRVRMINHYDDWDKGNKERKNSEKGGDHPKRYHYIGNHCKACGCGFINSSMKEEHEDFCLRRWVEGRN